MQDPSIDRRSVLSAGLLGLAGLNLVSSRAFGRVRLAASPCLGPLAAADRTLLLVQLSGGNDGLSMVVPYGDEDYHDARPTLRHRPDEVLVLDQYRGLHPELGGLRAQWEAGRLAIVEGAGYPDPTRSHFKSYDVWHTADRRGRVAGDGWIGRLCSAAWPESRDPNKVVHIGGKVPYSLHSAAHPPASFATPTGYRWAGDDEEVEAFESAGGSRAMPIDEGDEGGTDGASATGSRLEFLRKTLADGQASSREIRLAAARYRSRVEYPGNAFAAALRDVAALASGGVGTRVFSIELSGFDTHSNQRTRHEALMRRMDAGLGAFLADLEGTEAGRGLVVMVYSEFGRRLRENGSRGTDHGVAGPMLLLGEPVQGGLYGRHPSLTELDDGDLVHTTDFRSVYATLIERGFGIEQGRVLSGEYPLLPLLS